MNSIDELYTDNYSDDGSISKNCLGYIWYGSQIHPDINAGDTILKIRDLIKQTQNEWKGEELSENSIGKSLHQVSKAVVDELNNLFPTLI